MSPSLSKNPKILKGLEKETWRPINWRPTCSKLDQFTGIPTGIWPGLHLPNYYRSWQVPTGNVIYCHAGGIRLSGVVLPISAHVAPKINAELINSQSEPDPPTTIPAAASQSVPSKTATCSVARDQSLTSRANSRHSTGSFENDLPLETGRKSCTRGQTLSRCCV